MRGICQEVDAKKSLLFLTARFRHFFVGVKYPHTLFTAKKRTAKQLPFFGSSMEICNRGIPLTQFGGKIRHRFGNFDVLGTYGFTAAAANASADIVFFSFHAYPSSLQLFNQLHRLI